MTLAPIGLSTYARVEHLKRTVAALQRNTLAPQSELYVFSDGPRLGDEGKVAEVREFLRTVDGFRRVEILEREKNDRLLNNRQGIRMLLDKCGRMIFLEEDVVTAASFLDYLNQALHAYQDNPRIFSITAHCPPIDIPADYPYDVFTCPRFDPWGCGLWKDRFDRVEMRIPARVIRHIFANPVNMYRFSKGGLDMLPLALNNYFEYANGLDVRLFTQQFALNMFTVYPVKHLIRNIGLDGTGMHPKIKPHWNVELWNGSMGTLSLPADLEPDPRILKSMYRFRSGNYWNRTRQILWLILILIKRAVQPGGKSAPAA